MHGRTVGPQHFIVTAFLYTVTDNVTCSKEHLFIYYSLTHTLHSDL